MPHETIQQDSTQDAERSRPKVGELLRSRRLSRDEGLREVAQKLRIRYPYLEAIEEGRLSELPGPTYAIGFVRAYADYLGLTTEDVVARFKAESRQLESRSELVFPEPLPGSRVPGFALLLVAIMLGGMVYGGWLYVSGQDRSIAEIIPAVPERLAALISDVSGQMSDTPTPPPGTEAPAGEGAAPAAQPPTTQPPTTQPPTTQPSAVQPSAALPPAETGGDTASSAGGDEPWPGAQPQAVQPQAAQPQSPETTSAPEAAAQPVAEAPADGTAASQSDAAQSGAAEGEDAAGAPTPTTTTQGQATSGRSTSGQVASGQPPSGSPAAEQANPGQDEASQGTAAASSSPNAAATDTAPSAATGGGSATTSQPQIRSGQESAATGTAARSDAQGAPAPRTAAEAEENVAAIAEVTSEPLDPPAPDTSSGTPADTGTTTPDSAPAASGTSQGGVSQGGASESASAELPAVPDNDGVGDQIAPAAGSNGQIYGAAPDRSRVTLTARVASWVEVSGPTGQTLMARLLRAGETYRVPDEAGITLVTGNAGGLEILVDGERAPDIGPLGAVRRNVVLDPAKLKAGVAVGG